MSIKISSLTKDTSFKNDDYLLKDGATNGTRTISVQDAADDLARKSTVGLKRASTYSEATTIADGDFLIKDTTNTPNRITAANLATGLAQLATYPDGTSIGTDDYILKVTSTGVQKINAQTAAGNLYELAGEMAGTEMLEEAIAKGIVDQAMQNAIEETVPDAADAIRAELRQGTGASSIVDAAYDLYDSGSSVGSTDLFLKRDRTQGSTTVVTAEQIVNGALAVILASGLDDSTDTVLIRNGSTLGEVSMADFISYMVANADPTDIPAATIEHIVQNIDPTDITAATIEHIVQNIDPTDITAATIEYLVTHIPLDTNAAADTVDGQLTQALTDLGILNDVVDPDPT
jgi:hypothetical protein